MTADSHTQSKLYACDIDEGCTAAFMKLGNLINHILLGKQYRSIERLSLKDSAMEFYHCKLEEVGNRRMISIDLNVKQENQSERYSLPKADEMFKENQICSFFGRMKRGKETSTLKKLPIDADSENEGLEKFTDFETSVAEIITIENLFLNAKKALETSAAQKCISNNNLLVPEINASDFHETYYPTFKPYHTKRNSFNTRKLISRNDYARKKRKFDTAEAENFGLAFGITWKTFISVQQ
ncbi:unnamed protein product, partial [Rotaria magnacalcarata]